MVNPITEAIDAFENAAWDAGNTHADLGEGYPFTKEYLDREYRELLVARYALLQAIQDHADRGALSHVASA